MQQDIYVVPFAKYVIMFTLYNYINNYYITLYMCQIRKNKIFNSKIKYEAKAVCKIPLVSISIIIKCFHG